MSEFDTGYSVDIGKPVIHAEKKATGSSVSFPCEAIPDGSYLVSLEVNGSVKAYRESMDFSSGSCTVGAYTLSYSSYALTVSGTSNNDIVRVMVEPLDVKTTDAFRAAVKKDAWATGKSVYIISTQGDTADLGASEISTLAQGGVLPVLMYSNRYYVYAYTLGSAFFVTSYYSQNNKVIYLPVSVGSNKRINTYPSIELYKKPTDGIPETDLAQAVKDKLNKFVVTLTPTAQDFSGTMDKTGEEITAAYEAGQEIVLQIDYQNLLYTIDVSYVRDGRPSYTFITFVALFTLNGNLVQISTQQDTYDTDIFTLTTAT